MWNVTNSKDMPTSKKLALWESQQGDRVQKNGKCAYRRGYTMGSNDCVNCRYNRNGSKNSSITIADCVAGNYIKPLTEMNGAEEQWRNRELRLVMRGQRSGDLDRNDRNKDKAKKKTK